MSIRGRLKAGGMGPGLAARRGRAGGRLELMALRLGTGSGTFTTCRLPEGGRFTCSIAVFGDKFQLEIQIQTLSDYRRGSGVWKIPPIIGHADNRIRTFSKRGARFDHVGQGQPLPVDHERG